MSQTLQSLRQDIRQQLLPITLSPEQASSEADLILEEVLHIAPVMLHSNGEQSISEQQALLVQSFIEQRTHKRIPIQYLLHQAWFYGLKFYVNPHVLIPRPETELLVEKALSFIQPGMSILDVGTGPGTIAIALSYKLGDKVRIVASDLCPDALKVAKINQKYLGTGVEFKDAGNLFKPVGTETFDLIVSNPPYIDTALQPSLMPEVLWHEPAVALFPPGQDPFYFYRRLAQEGKQYLKPGGRLLVEVGVEMSPDITQFFMAEGYQNIEIIEDYAGIERIVIGNRP